ncbi:porin [Roseomonas sp. HJA6]|uniref:Porin n=1 Tax=Roseomonas alba TaxID=2846776 RepID=A0ABS7AA90_9PROT|nr:porin [Neoroseomonas alba]MBW6399202.1 porin [Neoroseomonas alba]
MRKILLGTTAVVGAALLAPGAFAQTTQGGGGRVGQGVTVPTAPGTVGVAPTPLNVGPSAPNTQVVQAPTPAMAGAGGLTIRLGGYFAFTGAMVQDDWDYGRSRNFANQNTSVGAYTGNLTTGAATTGRPGTSVPSNAGTTFGQPVNNARSRSRYDFRNDAELNIFVDGRTSNGITYGAVFEMQMDNVVATAGDGTTVSFDELYGYIGFDGLGTFRFGQEDSAASLLQVRAPASQALGGDAEWDEFIVQTGLTDSSPYIMSGINDGNDATKVIYLSPQFAGFDFGVSYAANSGEGERTNNEGSTTAAQRDRLGIENEMSAAVRYRGTFGPVGVIAGLGGMWASPPSLNGAGQALGAVGNPRAQNVYAYTAGLVLTGYGFSFGGEYTWGAYRGASVGRTAVAAGVDNSQHYLLGLTYTMGPLVFGAVWGQGWQGNGVSAVRTSATTVAYTDLDDRRQDLWGLGVAYNLAPGLVLFGLYNNITDENVPMGGQPSNARYLAAPTTVGARTGTTLAQFNGGNTRSINVGIVGIRLAF